MPGRIRMTVITYLFDNIMSSVPEDIADGSVHSTLMYYRERHAGRAVIYLLFVGQYTIYADVSYHVDVYPIVRRRDNVCGKPQLCGIRYGFMEPAKHDM